VRHLIALFQHKPCPRCAYISVLIINNNQVIIANVDRAHHLFKVIFIRHHIRQMSIWIRKSFKVEVHGLGNPFIHMILVRIIIPSQNCGIKD
jgi:hypothetical protein